MADLAAVQGMWNSASGAFGNSVTLTVEYGVLIAVLLIGGFLFMHLMKFRLVNCQYFDVASGKNKKTKFGWSDQGKTSWKCLADGFGFSRQTHLPCPDQYIFNRTVYARRDIHGRFDWRQNPLSEVTTLKVEDDIPSFIEENSQLQHAKYQSQYGNSKEKQMAMWILMSCIIGGCLIVIAAIYFAYQYGTPPIDAIKENTGAIGELVKTMGGKIVSAPPPA